MIDLKHDASLRKIKSAPGNAEGRRAAATLFQIEKQGERWRSDLNSAAEQSPAKAGPPEQFRTVEIKSVAHAFTLSENRSILRMHPV
ncbi:MAG: hypothetical protein ACLST7_02055 [Oscillospiraceae bacterium]|jgi:hypothetical protein